MKFKISLKHYCKVNEIESDRRPERTYYFPPCTMGLYICPSVHLHISKKELNSGIYGYRKFGKYFVTIWNNRLLHLCQYLRCDTPSIQGCDKPDLDIQRKISWKLQNKVQIISDN